MTGDKVTTRRTSEERRQQIAAAAVTCLTLYGYAGLTARRVASQAGISLGHLTYHYATMDEVLAAAYAQVAHDLTVPEPAPSATPAARLDSYLNAVFAPEFLTQAQLRLRVDLWSAAQSYPAVAQIELDLQNRNRATIEGLLTAICDPWKTARIPMVEAFVLAVMDGLWLEYMRHQDLDTVHAAIEACVLFARMRLGGT